MEMNFDYLYVFAALKAPAHFIQHSNKFELNGSSSLGIFNGLRSSLETIEDTGDGIFSVGIIDLKTIAENIYV